MSRIHRILLLLLLITLPALAQEAKVEKHVEKDAKGNLVSEYTTVDGKRHGRWTNWHSGGGNKYCEGDYEHGSRTGTWTWYFKDGTKAIVKEYKEDKANGPATSYFESGSKYVEGTFKDDTLTGEYKQYHANGNVFMAGVAAGGSMESPSKTGKWTWYFEGGEKWYEAEYSENAQHGLATAFSKTGQRVEDVTYADGEVSGTFTRYGSNGSPVEIGEVYGTTPYRAGGPPISTEFRYPFEPLKSGMWAYYMSNGTVWAEVNYTANRADGEVKLFWDEGIPKVVSVWVEGQQKGSWTAWHQNGNMRGHGHAYAARPGYGGPRDCNLSEGPLKTGPWVWYHENGAKESEGRYELDKPVGPWIYYDKSGAMSEVKNFVDGKSKGVSSATLQGGGKVVRTSGTDGSSDTFTFDKDGKLVSRDHKLPPGKQKSTIEYTDPDTKEETIVSYDPTTGVKKVTKRKTEEHDNGSTTTTEESDNGDVEVIEKQPDGRETRTLTRADGGTVKTEKAADGTIQRTVTDPDGDVREYKHNPDGSSTRVRRDPDGKLIDTTERNPAGVETTTKADGTTTRRHKDEDGNYIETTEKPDGTSTRVKRDKDGNVLSKDTQWGDRKPGQALYQDVENGKEWEKLSTEEKQAYADREEKLKESGRLDKARQQVVDSEIDDRGAQRADVEQSKADALRDLARKIDAEKRHPDPGKVDPEKLSQGAKALELALASPEVMLEPIRKELEAAIEAGDEDLIAELRSLDREELPGWLNRHPKVMENWENKVKPTIKSGGAGIQAALSVVKGVDLIHEGKYGEALMSFADASVSALGAIPEGEMAKIQKELKRSPVEYASAIKNLLAFGHEVCRELEPGESRNYGKLAKEGVEFFVNAYKAIPEAQRKEFIERQGATLRKWLGKVEKGVPGGKLIMDVVDCAPEIYRTISEWGGENDVANITSLTQKVGPKVIKLLVSRATGSEAAGEAAEFVAQLGADYMAHLGNEAREAAKAALKQAGNDSASYTRMRAELQTLARNAGMTPRDAEQYETLSTAVSGHNGKMELSMRESKDLLGVRESMQAWRRVDDAMGKHSAAVSHFYDSLDDDRSDAAYHHWCTSQSQAARRTSEYIDSIIGDYQYKSAAYRYLKAWQQDLDHMAAVFE